MGMYTEFLFQGETKANVPANIKELFDYFFNENTNGGEISKPDHDFFKTSRWQNIGHANSYYFNPFALRHKQEHIIQDGTQRVFLMCSLKNYHDEIKLFLDWIDTYMEFYWGHYCYEEDEEPTFFKVRR